MVRIGSGNSAMADTRNVDVSPIGSSIMAPSRTESSRSFVCRAMSRIPGLPDGVSRWMVLTYTRALTLPKPLLEFVDLSSSISKRHSPFSHLADARPTCEQFLPARRNQRYIAPVSAEQPGPAALQSQNSTKPSTTSGSPAFRGYV